MKIVKFSVGQGYAVEKELPMLDPDFSRNSFLLQVLPHLQAFKKQVPLGQDRKFLVFDQQEEEAAMRLFAQIFGGTVTDSGMGHIRNGEISGLNITLSPLQHSATYIPKQFEQDGKKPIVEVSEWSLALQ